MWHPAWHLEIAFSDHLSCEQRPVGKLTDVKIRKARPSDRDRYLSDGDGLRLRVKPSGAKFFELRYRIGGKLTPQGLGSYPALSLKDAREESARIKKLLEKGIDPKAEAARMAALRQAEALERSVRGLYDDWMESYILVHRKRPEHVRSFMEADVLPHIGKIKARDVTKTQIVEVINQIVNRNAKVKADRVLSMVKQMFSHGVGKGILPTHPCPDLQRKHFGIKPVSSQRHLSESEIVELLGKLPDSGLPERIQAAVRLLLATGQRTCEMRLASWDEINWEARLWTIPKEHSKNGKPHQVHLSSFALRQFAVLRQFSTDGGLVLESTRKPGSAMDEKSLSKMIRDRQRQTPLKNRSGSCDSLRLGSGDWSPHDLRHTAHTGMGGLGIPPYIVEKILNHTMPGIMAVYNHQEYLPERREALERWGAYLDRLQSADLSNVISITRVC